MKLKSIILNIIFVGCAFSSHAQIIDTLKINTSAVINLGNVNNKDSQFSPSFGPNGLIYVEYKQKRKSKDLTRTERAFDLMQVDIINDSLGMIQSFESINSSYVEGPSCYSPDFQKLYITRSNMNETGAKKSADKLVRMKIFEATKDSLQWTQPKEISFILGDYNYCHPSISGDGEIMIIASDLPGGYGKMDLYLLRKDGDAWSTPTNLGPTVNTAANDWFGFYHDSGVLFYASDGKDPSKGDLDIYAVDLKEGNIGESQKLPQPINSESDDFGFIMNKDQTSAYFSSARSGGKGRDDIYELKFSGSIIEKEKQDSLIVQFVVKELATKKAIQNADIKFTKIGFAGQRINPEEYDLDLIIQDNGDQNVVIKLEDERQSSLYQTDQNGKYVTKLGERNRFLVEVSKDKYNKEAFIYVPKIGDSKDVFLDKMPEKKVVIQKPEIYIPTEKGSVVVFDNIYYDLNSAEIKSGAAKELDALLKIMTDNPYIKVQLSAHTDAQGNDVYNQILSDQRAQSAKKYLSSRGINPSRIVAIGFGESRLRNHCADDVPCTKEEHQYNRRTEVKILEN